MRRTLYVAMDDRSGEIIAVNILFMVLTTVIVALRAIAEDGLYGPLV